ncbi:MAG: polysaccharide lyase family 7 protein [Bacteroidota bacterium]
MAFCPIVVSAQSPSDLLPDLEYFKLTFPLDVDGNDYTGIAWEDRDAPHIKSWEQKELMGWTASGDYAPYFFVEGNEVVFRAHCAGALTSPNAYPRCELRERPDGIDELWSMNDEHELSATFRITNLPNVKKEVNMLQIKGGFTKDDDDGEAFRLEYREGSSQGMHVTINEDNTLNDIMEYSLGQTLVARMYVNDGDITIEVNNLDVEGSRGEWSITYESDFGFGYFKAGCYTQSSIWTQKSGQSTPEEPTAYGEVRFSALEVTGTNSVSTTLPDGIGQNKLSVYPNPFQESLSVKIPEYQAPFSQLLLLNALGQEMYKWNSQNTGEEIEIPGSLSSGIYMLQWVDQTGKLLQVEKIIKQ